MKKIPKSFEDFNVELEKKVDAMMTLEPSPKAEAVVPAKLSIREKLKRSRITVLDNDSELDAAVSEIEQKEDSGSDEDMPPLDETKKPKKTKKNKTGRLSKKVWLGVLFFILGLIAIAAAAYFFYHPGLQITLKDSQNGSLISAAAVEVNGKTYQSDSSGVVQAKLKIGPNKITIAKKYYQNFKSSFWEFFGSKSLTYSLVATGRIVDFKILNYVDRSPVVGASITYDSTKALTASDGTANLIVPTGSNNVTVSISAPGYNDAKETFSINGTSIKQFTLVPSGSLYYVSNANGFDVMSSNLDGSNEQTVLSGSGSENLGTEALYASPDWSYLVLRSTRNSATQEGLYIINTSNNNFTEFDSNNTYTPIGWYGHNFLYLVTSGSSSVAGYQQIKAYNALTNEISLIDSSTVSGSGSSYAYQVFSNFNIIASNLFYSAFYTSVGSPDLSSVNDSVNSVNLSTLNKTVALSLPAANLTSISLIRSAINSFGVTVESSAVANQYYSYNPNNQTITSSSSATSVGNFSNFFLTPSGNYYWQSGNNIYSYSLSSPTAKLLGSTSKKLIGVYNNYLIFNQSGNLYISGLSNISSPVAITNSSSGNVVATYYEF